ncbi:MAG: glycosyltransferase family 2 protein [Nanoarchaeota archaeon]|nr:glycosyltransferase family 2 protein [Nanoarchaeota archaeon]
MNSLSLIIPVHNGEKFIERSLKEYFDFFTKRFQKLEIVVVCNACTDNTFNKSLNFSSKFPLKVLNVPERGKGNALIAGFGQAQNEIIGFLDADNSFDLNEISKMISYLENADVVIVSKFKKNDFKHQTSLTRRFFSLGASLVSKMFFGINASDTQGGAKFMKRTVWNKIDKKFICKGFEFDIELLFNLKKVNAKIKEYFILPKTTDFSTVKLRILPGIIFRLLKLRFLR